MRFRCSDGLSVVLALASVPGAVAAQFAAGGREIFVLNLAGVATGSVPSGLRMLQGTAVTTLQGGVVMLKAATIAEFVIDLSEKLPDAFTLQFEITPKSCCPNPDLSVAGTPGQGNSGNSAEIAWYRDHVTVTGGGLQPYTGSIPPRISDVVAGALTNIDVSFEGETIKLYTNGTRIFTLTDRRFTRGRVLRVLLGGTGEVDGVVYLSKLRVATGPPVVAQQPPVPAPAPTPVSAVLMPPPPAPAATGMVTPAPAPAPSPVNAVVLPSPAPAPATGTITPLPPSAGSPTVGTGNRSTSTTPVAGRTATTETRTSFFAPPAPRTIQVTGFTAAGPNLVLPPRTLATPGFTAAGMTTVLLPRSIPTLGFTAAGPAPRTIRGTTATPPPVSPRTLITTGFIATGARPAVPPRTLSTSGFAAKGVTTVVAPRTLTTAGWTAAGAKTP